MERQPPFMTVATTVQGETLFHGMSQVSSCKGGSGSRKAARHAVGGDSLRSLERGAARSRLTPRETCEM